MKEERYTAILLEDINSKIEAVLEIVIPLAKLPVSVRQLQSDIGDIKSDLRTTNLIVRSHSKSLHNHEPRITHLESA